MDQFYNYENIFLSELNSTTLNEEQKVVIMNLINKYLQIRDPQTNLSIIKSLPKFFVISKICEKLNYQKPTQQYSARKPSDSKMTAMMNIWQEIMDKTN